MGRDGGISHLQPHDDLAGLAGVQALETGFEVFEVDVVGDHRADVEAAAEHRHHLVPGLEHFAPVDPLQADALEDRLVEVYPRRSSRASA